LLYGNDIGKAKRILFNLYASSEHPIIVREMLEIDDFFDQLDPNINVIWGTSTDDSLGEDAKVTILATGLEDEARNTILADVHRDEDDFYEDLINQLYKPVKKEVSMVITKDVEVPFDVKPVQAVEPAVEEPVVKVPADDEPVGEEPEKPVVEPVTVEERPAVETPIKEEPTSLNKWKIWLSNLIKDVTE